MSARSSPSESKAPGHTEPESQALSADMATESSRSTDPIGETEGSTARVMRSMPRAQGLPVGVLNPALAADPLSSGRRTLPCPQFGRRIEVADLLGSQLPDPLTDKSGNVVLSRTGHRVRRPRIGVKERPGPLRGRVNTFRAVTPGARRPQSIRSISLLGPSAVDRPATSAYRPPVPVRPQRSRHSD